MLQEVEPALVIPVQPEIQVIHKMMEMVLERPIMTEPLEEPKIHNLIQLDKIQFKIE